MSKSNKKKHDRLRDSTHHENLKSNRHIVKQLIREGRLDEIDDLDEDFSPREKEPE